MESEENQTQVSLPSHSPWKSLRDSHIPTAPTTSPFTKKQPKKRRPCGGSLRSRLQAHSSMRKCCACEHSIVRMPADRIPRIPLPFGRAWPLPGGKAASRHTAHKAHYQEGSSAEKTDCKYGGSSATSR